MLVLSHDGHAAPTVRGLCPTSDGGMHVLADVTGVLRAMGRPLTASPPHGPERAVVLRLDRALAPAGARTLVLPPGPRRVVCGADGEVLVLHGSRAPEASALPRLTRVAEDKEDESFVLPGLRLAVDAVVGTDGAIHVVGVGAEGAVIVTLEKDGKSRRALPVSDDALFPARLAVDTHGGLVLAGVRRRGAGPDGQGFEAPHVAVLRLDPRGVPKPALRFDAAPFEIGLAAGAGGLVLTLACGRSGCSTGGRVLDTTIIVRINEQGETRSQVRDGIALGLSASDGERVALGGRAPCTAGFARPVESSLPCLAGALWTEPGPEGAELLTPVGHRGEVLITALAQAAQGTLLAVAAGPGAVMVRGHVDDSSTARTLIVQLRGGHGVQAARGLAAH